MNHRSKRTNLVSPMAERRPPIKGRATCEIRSIVVADCTEKRGAERKLYQKRCRELDLATKRMKVFEDKDRPAFTQWLEVEFSVEMLKCRECTTAVAALGEQSDMVRYWAEIKGLTLRAAYAEIKAAKAAGRIDELLDNDGSEKGTSTDENDDDFDNFENVFEDIFSECFDSLADDPFFAGAQEDGGNAREQSWKQPSSKFRTGGNVRPSGTPSNDHLKSVYRQLVRILHPDSNKSLTSRQQELWHEVQEAYSWRDIQRLEKLLQTATGGAAMGLNLGSIPIFHIMDLRRDVEKRLRLLKRKLSLVRKEIAWDFCSVKSDPRHLRLLRIRIAEGLAWDLDMIRSELRKFEREVAGWEKSPAKRKQKTSAGNSSGEYRQRANRSFPMGFFD